LCDIPKYICILYTFLAEGWPDSEKGNKSMKIKDMGHQVPYIGQLENLPALSSRLTCFP
jgi:hypothetical protein